MEGKRSLAKSESLDPWLDQKPGIISHKENLMEKSKELVKTNQNSSRPISKGKTTRVKSPLLNRDKSPFSQPL